ncbi:hypothetical protein ACT5YR_07405 [Fructobacillus fructosus]|uniref:hypothetical protein n=1 Tax=Fructobacillus fructosus TaxID=1631 RepID=UPI00403477BB
MTFTTPETTPMTVLNMFAIVLAIGFIAAIRTEIAILIVAKAPANIAPKGTKAPIIIPLNTVEITLPTVCISFLCCFKNLLMPEKACLKDFPNSDKSFLIGLI